MAAFTLIELMVVVAVISVLAGIGLPAMRHLARGNGKAQAQVMARAWIAAARGVAMSQHRMAGVVFFEETPAHARPANTSATAVQIFVEDFDQTDAKYPTLRAGNTIFLPLNSERQYLPGGIAVAALNDQARGIETGDEASATVGKSRAILFDARGNMLLRHGLACPAAGSGVAGTYPKAALDWNFASPSQGNAIGISSPGVFLYDMVEYKSANIPTTSAGDAQRNQWIKSHADVVIVNAVTGGFLQ